MSSPEETPSPKPFRVQRRRLGRIRFVHPEGQYGFIEAEDFRDDVFFHRRDWSAQSENRQSSSAELPEIGTWVEFELDDEHFAVEKKLRAKVVRPTDRPSGRKLSGRDATFQITTHHPRARRRRPDWRK